MVVCLVHEMRQLGILDNIILNGQPTTFIEKLKYYSTFNSSFILNPSHGITLLANDYFQGDNSLLTQYKYPELVFEGIKDKKDAGTLIVGESIIFLGLPCCFFAFVAVMQLLEPMTAQIRQVTYLTCSNPQCHMPRGRIQTSDPTSEILLECQTPGGPAPVSQIIQDYFQEGYQTIGKFKTYLLVQCDR